MVLKMLILATLASYAHAVKTFVQRQEKKVDGTKRSHEKTRKAPHKFSLVDKHSIMLPKNSKALKTNGKIDLSGKISSMYHNVVKTVECAICKVVVNQVINFPQCLLLGIGAATLLELFILGFDLGILGTILGVVVAAICRSQAIRIQAGAFGYSVGEKMCLDHGYCDKDRVESQEIKQFLKFQNKLIDENPDILQDSQSYLPNYFDAFCKTDFCLGPEPLDFSPRKCNTKCLQLCTTNVTCDAREDAVKRVQDIVHEQKRKEKKRVTL